MESQRRKDEFCCKTQTRIASISYKWTIKNICPHKNELGYREKSSEFFSSAARNVKWLLDFYASDIRKEFENSTSLILGSRFDNNIYAKASFSLSILDRRNVMIFAAKQSTPAVSVEKLTGDWGWCNLMKTADMFALGKSYTPDETLTIPCEIKIIESAPFNDSGDCVPEKIPESRLGQDFEALLNTEILSDVILIASGRKFNVHKAILAARSQVFATKFSTEAENVEILVDVNPDILKSMLHFIYTAEIPEMTAVNFAFDLLTAADKYAIERLKLLCEDYICRSLTVENVSEALILAESHNVERLKTKATDFIQNHIAAVQKTDGWMSLFRNRQKEQPPKDDEEKK